jgi:hypothetical protein
MGTDETARADESEGGGGWGWQPHTARMYSFLDIKYSQLYIEP